MRYFNIILFCAPIALLIECTKNSEIPIIEKPNIYDTIIPLDYLPAYPGSYWVYTNGDTLRCKDDYQVHALYSEWDMYESKVVVGDCVCVPIYGDSYLMGYNILRDEKDCHLYIGCSTITLLSENLGETLSDCNYGHPHDDFSKSRRVIAIDTSVIINNKKIDSVIVVGHFISISSGPQTKYANEYYAKNIGKIKQEGIEQELVVTPSSFEIVNYFINIE